jgi:hypothetical protein
VREGERYREERKRVGGAEELDILIRSIEEEGRRPWRLKGPCLVLVIK